ncbi:MAG TPA: response regulator [Ktedonobacteraceae bacterium]|nr:response regulator [Ktedonobacteraceae bacterium]
MPKRIVVVDDDKEVQEIIAFVLRRSGFDVDIAYNGGQLQGLLVGFRPDLIILDVMMPGQDGYQIFSGLQKNPETRAIPVIIMTAHAEDIYERISLDLGVTEHMTKPFHPLELVEKIKVILQTSS